MKKLKRYLKALIRYYWMKYSMTGKYGGTGRKMGQNHQTSGRGITAV